MSIFLKATEAMDKSKSLLDLITSYRRGDAAVGLTERSISSFGAIPGRPMAYWVPNPILAAYRQFAAFEPTFGTVIVGAQTSDDFRFVRLSWEVNPSSFGAFHWAPFLKGGSASTFYADINATLNWREEGKEIKAFSTNLGQHWSRNIRSVDQYFQPGISWAVRTQRFKPSVVPSGCIPSVSRYIAKPNDIPILSLVAFWSSRVTDDLLKVRLEKVNEPKYIAGLVKNLPQPEYSLIDWQSLRRLGHTAWSRQRDLRKTIETSVAFELPAALLQRLGEYDIRSIEAKLAEIQSEIDHIAFDLYGFSAADRNAAFRSIGGSGEDELHSAANADESEDDDDVEAVDQTDGLFSWLAGVAFGRFDWRLATGEREAPPEPDPFDPLPAKSAGMLPDGAEPFHAHSGILVDDQGHPHDLPRLMEEVLARVNAEVPGEVRRWVQRDFFPLHLKQYSKSRRKAPIYWPLSTNSGNYTLWLYYPELTSQTLYSAVNDFVEPKLTEVSREADTLRNKGAARSRDDEKSLEALQALELELIELRDTLLHIAPTYRPNHNDGVQITAAPLWQLFRYKSWQKILKDTWAKLEKGEYDWAHLAMAYWPDRVREKCKTDKSLAIAHDLEELYIEPEPRTPKSGKLKKDAE